MGAILTLAKLALAWEGGLQVRENLERWHYYNHAREHANSVGKPLLVVGMKRWPWQPPNGDVTIDIDPAVETVEGGIIADEREIPFPDKYFGACYNAHTLEHMFTAEDCELAVNECTRVADNTVFLCPSPYSIVANLFCPSHHLRLWFDQVNQRIKVTEKSKMSEVAMRGREPQSNRRRISQSLVVQEAPEIVKIGSA